VSSKELLFQKVNINWGLVPYKSLLKTVVLIMFSVIVIRREFVIAEIDLIIRVYC
jgi:hypothetical protein